MSDSRLVNAVANEVPDLSPVSAESLITCSLESGSTFSLIVSVVVMLPGSAPVTSRLIVSVVVMLPGCCPSVTSLTVFVVLVLDGCWPVSTLRMSFVVAWRPAVPPDVPLGDGLPPPWPEIILPSRPPAADCCGDGAPVSGCGENSAFSAPRMEPCGLERSRDMASREIALSRSANALRARGMLALSKTALILILCGVSSSFLTSALNLSRSALALAVLIESVASMDPASHPAMSGHPGERPGHTVGEQRIHEGVRVTAAVQAHYPG